jgi:tight adherence protein C
MKQIVEQFNLPKWLGTDKAKLQMAMAGFRGPQAEVAFLFFRLVTPVLSLAVSAFYIFGRCPA